LFKEGGGSTLYTRSDEYREECSFYPREEKKPPIFSGKGQKKQKFRWRSSGGRGGIALAPVGRKREKKSSRRYPLRKTNTSPKERR